jgi:hypothetical protein
VLLVWRERPDRLAPVICRFLQMDREGLGNLVEYDRESEHSASIYEAI